MGWGRWGLISMVSMKTFFPTSFYWGRYSEFINSLLNISIYSLFSPFYISWPFRGIWFTIGTKLTKVKKKRRILVVGRGVVNFLTFQICWNLFLYLCKICGEGGGGQSKIYFIVASQARCGRKSNGMCKFMYRG